MQPPAKFLPVKEPLLSATSQHENIDLAFVHNVFWNMKDVGGEDCCIKIITHLLRILSAFLESCSEVNPECKPESSAVFSETHNYACTH